jgi:5-methylcytosine-specific restriction protein A
MSWGYERGKAYNRTRDVQERFGGTGWKGIVTTKEGPTFVFSSKNGAVYGYENRMLEDGVFEYFGQGASGDQTFKDGNAAILNHAENGKSLLVFTRAKPDIFFEGEYVYAGHHFTDAPGEDGKIRQAIVFELRPIEAVEDAAQELIQVSYKGTDLSTLRTRAMEAAKAAPKASDKTVSVYERTAVIKTYIFARANGKCEDCGEVAPFLTAKGRPFLEAHHIRRMSDGGPDDPRHMIALCPNCHRGAHYAHDAQVRNERMAGFVKMIEGKV